MDTRSRVRNWIARLAERTRADRMLRRRLCIVMIVVVAAVLAAYATLRGA